MEVMNSTIQLAQPNQVLQLIRPKRATFKLPEPLRLASSTQEFQEIWQLRDDKFSIYPAVEQGKTNDIYDHNAWVLYTTNAVGEYVSTGRVAFDGEAGLPADDLVKPELDTLRDRGFKLAELGKFAIRAEGKGMLPLYLNTYHKIGELYDMDYLIFIIPAKHASLYRKTLGGDIVLQDIGYSYGTNSQFALLTSPIERMGECVAKYWKVH